MKKLLITLLFCWCTPLFADSSKTVTIATGEYAPYCSSSIKHKGFVSHVISEAFGREGYRVEFDFLPWKRAKKQSRVGGYDATSWWAYNPERAENFYYSDEVVKSSLHFFYLKSKNFDFDWKTLSDTAGRSIGVSRSYHYSDEFAAYRKDHPEQIEEVNDDEQNFRRLLRGRTDLFPVDVVVGLEMLRTKFGPNVIHQVAFHPRPLTSRAGFLLFPKVKGERSEELREVFNRGLKKIREDGTYDRMYDDLLSGVYSR